MQVFLETERLLLRRFTEADEDHLFDLDRDPEVVRFINGGTPTPRDVIEDDLLPRFLWYYERFADALGAPDDGGAVLPERDPTVPPRGSGGTALR